MRLTSIPNSCKLATIEKHKPPKFKKLSVVTRFDFEFAKYMLSLINNTVEQATDVAILMQSIFSESDWQLPTPTVC